MADLEPGAASSPEMRLRQIVARLRAPDGCPWDRDQTHATLRAGLVEECYELIDAIDAGDDENLREELGDLLLQVVMHAQIGSERGAFAMDDVETEICEKLIRRHPHVFGNGSAADSSEVLIQWDQLKAAEKGDRESVLDGIPKGLPALMRAWKVQRKAAKVGFDWPDTEGVLEKIEEEAREIEAAADAGSPDQIQEELGDLLFSVVNLARKLQVDPEFALREATIKFEVRFRAVENAVRAAGRRMQDCSLDELDAHWEAQKAKVR